MGDDADERSRIESSVERYIARDMSTHTQRSASHSQRLHSQLTCRNEFIRE